MISRGQLQALGYSDSAISRATSSGRLHRVHRGVYAVGHRSLSAYGHCHAALLACGRGSLLSHSSAAWLWGLFPRLAMPVEVTQPTRGHRRGTLRVHYASSLSTEDRTKQEGLRVTSVARMLDLDTIDALLARAEKHPGVRKLRDATDLFRHPAFTRSGLERHFLALVRSAGLPMPSANVFVNGFELDMYWERERFAVELDGYEHHGGRSSFESDRLRHEELTLGGIEMIRVTDWRLAREPDAVMKRVAALLAQRR